MTTEEDSKLITGPHLMTLISIKDDRTLAKLRKQGLPHVRLGGLYRYNFIEVAKWLHSKDSISLSPTDRPMEVFSASEEPEE